MIAKDFLNLLQGVTGRDGERKALCPAHKDHKPSLSVTETPGRILVYCHSGCSTEAIVEALGLQMKNLFTESMSSKWTAQDADIALSNRGLRPDTIKRFEIKPDLEKQAWRFPLGKDRPDKFKFKSFDANGTSKYYVEKGTKHDVYHLIPCVGEDEAWLVEGESDVWIMHQANLPVFSFTGGAGSVPAIGVQKVAEASIGVVHIIYDRDQEGREGAWKVAREFDEAGVAYTVHELPESVGDKGDVTNLYNNLGGDDLKFREAIRALKPAEGNGTKKELNELRHSNWQEKRLSSLNSFFVLARWPEKLSPEAFHGLVGRWVQIVGDHTEADPAAILTQFLVMAGNAMGRGPHYRVEADRHYTNENLLLLGPTATGRKGTSYGQAKAPFERAMPTWTQERIATGLSSGEGLIWAVRDPTEKKEPIKEKGRAIDYQTVVVDSGVEDKRLLVVEAEFGNVLRHFQRLGNTLSPLIRSAWETGNLRTLIKNSPVCATGAHISIIGHCTAAELRGQLDRTEIASGFLNRFLLICTRRARILPDGGRPDEHEVADFARQLQGALDFAEAVGEMGRSPDARKLWFEVYEGLTKERPALLGAVASRAPAHVLRLSCIYALLDKSATIQVEHLRAALAVWKYVEESAAFVFGSLLGEPVADTIYEALLQQADRSLAKSEIFDLFHGNKSAEEINQALAQLQELDRVDFEKESTGGRPVERWKVKA